MNKKAYLIGIKGVGMTAMAVYLKKAGFEVVGSDTSDSFVTEKILKKEEIPYFNQFSRENLKGQKPDLLIISAAYDEQNPEVKEAKKRRLNTVYYSEALGQITAGKKVIAVAGVHGKTTITSIIALILKKAQLSPSYIIGAAEIPVLGSNAQKGEGDYFVLEADEYRKSPSDNSPKFLDIVPNIAIISSVELDHPDVFESIDDITRAFYNLACRIPRDGLIVINTDYPKSKKIIQSLADRRFETYGLEPGAKWQVVDFKEKKEITEFFLSHLGEKIGPFVLKKPGRHNALNATAAIIVANHLGVSFDEIKKILPAFEGVERRFQVLGEKKEITIIDDYAHHPAAIRQTLMTIREKFPQAKIWAIFQPHTYSRTKALLKDFSQSFENADRVIVTEIFASSREKEATISGLELAEEVKKYNSSVRFMTDWEKIKDYIFTLAKGPTVIVTIGAGDIYKLGQEIFKSLEEQDG